MYLNIKRMLPKGVEVALSNGGARTPNRRAPLRATEELGLAPLLEPVQPSHPERIPRDRFVVEGLAPSQQEGFLNTGILPDQATLDPSPVRPSWDHRHRGRVDGDGAGQR
jgi:hypothetical protein